MSIHDGHRGKMKERYKINGLDGFSDHEVLELLLFYAIPRKNTNKMAHDLINRYGSLSAVFAAPREDLEKVEDIGPSASVLIHLLPDILKKARLQDVVQDTILTSTEAAGKYLLECFVGEKTEVIYQLCLDRKGKLIAAKRLSEGGIASAALNVRKLIENALLTSASGVILSHNHPSGVALPSGDDYITTRKVREALETIGVMLLDHIIVADGDYVSFADSGFLRDL